MRNALDIALTGCATTLGCIENETRSLTTKIESDQKINFSDRAKVVWRNDRFKELVEQLHRQHNVIAILQQGLQMYGNQYPHPSFPKSESLTSVLGRFLQILYLY